MKDLNKTAPDHLLTHVTNIVCTIVQNNAIRPEDVPALIEAVHKCYKKLANEPPQPLTSPLKGSPTQEYIFEHDDNLNLKTRKRH